VRLVALGLKDFRQFGGAQRLEFSQDESQNVTLVYGANGSGKTTLLNAFTWSLYGLFTDDFEQQERLLHDATWHNLPNRGSAYASVSVEFEHDRSLWRLTRKARFVKDQDRPQRPVGTDVELLRTEMPGGTTRPVGNPGEAIDQTLPADLHRFFFFNGERIEHLTRPSAYQEIGTAIKTLLDLEALERAVGHLPTARRRLEAELVKLDKSKTLAAHQERKEELSAELQSVEAELQEAMANRAAAQEERDAVAQRLRALEGASALQEQRDDAERSLVRIRAQSAGIRAKVHEVLSDQGFLAFTRGLAAQTVERFEKLRERKQLPAPLKRQFVEDLLHDETCICGSGLPKGSATRKQVEGWLFQASLADVEEMWTTLASESKHFVQSREDLNKRLEDLQRELGGLADEERHVEEKLSELSSQLKGMPLEEVRKLEAQYEAVQRRISQHDQRIGGLNLRREEAKRGIDAAERQIDQAELKDSEARLAQRRAHVAAEAERVLSSVLRIRTDGIRVELDRRIKETFRAITYKPFVPSLSPDFTLQLSTPEGLPAVRSTGENQVLSLSFVGALAGMARERYEEAKAAPGGGLEATGGIYPIVMDAAFGNLDESYRRDVARALPTLAPQIIVLVSKAQGLGVVQTELEPRVGKTYVVQFDTSKENAPEETIEVFGRECSYIQQSTDGIDRATVVEVLK
jgi:DNA sulfur modification protein DndD